LPAIVKLGSTHNSAKGQIMSINSVSANVQNTSPVQPQTQPVRATEVENDKDKDDGASTTAVQSTPGPSVNTTGQVVGGIVNTQA